MSELPNWPNWKETTEIRGPEKWECLLLHNLKPIHVTVTRITGEKGWEYTFVEDETIRCALATLVWGRERAKEIAPRVYCKVQTQKFIERLMTDLGLDDKGGTP